MADELEPVNTFASMGGKAAAAGMSAEERKQRASLAAKARWHGDVLKATHGSPDHPLVIGSTSIPVYVLSNGQRVVVQAGMIEALGMVKGGSSHKGGTRLAKFVSQDRLKGFVTQDLVDRTQSPVRFQTPGGTLALGFDAEILAEICEAVLEAEKKGTLTVKQQHIAKQCWILYRGFARIGIVALIDEVTGYQKDRARDALAKILEAFIAKELQPYVRTFGADFYEELFRLKKLKFDGTSKRPRYIGQLTNNIVYSRLAPGVLAELQTKNPVTDTGRRKHHHHRHLTREVGHPGLKEHIKAVTTLMKASEDWNQFQKMIDRSLPVYRGPTLFDSLDKD